MKTLARFFPLARVVPIALALGLLLAGPTAAVKAAPLTTLEYQITGTQLRVSPIALAVPKGVAGSVRVDLIGAPVDSPLLRTTFVEALLRGPSFPARRVIGPVNQPLLLPPLPLVGDYQLDAIRLVDAATGNTVLEGVPGSVPVRVFDEVLVSRVTSRPLTLDEIREKGIAIDDQNFRAIEFEVGFVLDGKIIPVKFPVVAPTFEQSTEIIPAAELEERLRRAEEINQQLDLGALLPPELETARLNIDIKGINFEMVDPGEAPELRLSIPPIPALMVVPGNLGFLNQFFAVQIFTENGAPVGSGLSVFNVMAQLNLPPGADQVGSTNYDQPGDDPLRFARVGPDKIIQPIQPVVRPGPDRRLGTPDDIGRLLPAESGRGEFLVEGLQEGLHVMDLELTADLDGLAAGTVKIKGKAAGSVLVRNPKFSLAFSHPRTVRAGEPYDAYVTVLNTSQSIANLVQVTLNSASISGGVLETDETVVLGTIQPGQTATAKFRIRAQRTGAISFSNLTTSDDSLVGRFRLRAGVDERGVPLSPDTLLMPGFVTNLPPALVDAANRVLGQALSIATAPQLPPGVNTVSKGFVTRRVLDLAEAGQRVLYGDPLARVLPDLLLDWQGGREFGAGFDQIIRETDAGREWRETVFRQMDLADGRDALQRIEAGLPDLAGRGEGWALLAIDVETGDVRFGPGSNGSFPDAAIGRIASYDHLNAPSGRWWVEPLRTNLVLEWRLTNAVLFAELALAEIQTNGTARLLRWAVANLPAGACVRYAPGSATSDLRVDANCDGTTDSTFAASIQSVGELPPSIVSVRQDPLVQVARPPKPCTIEFPNNYGTVLAVLFSKPMQQQQVNVPQAYRLDNGNVAGSVQVQPGGRVALLNMRLPVSALRTRTMTVSEVTDPRGHVITNSVVRVRSDLTSGVAVRGRVARADGSPAAAIPVTLTMYDRNASGFSCEDFTVRVSQTFTDADGYFEFDYVMAGVPYSVSATDTAGLSPEALQIVLDSAAGDQFSRARLLELANSPGAQNTLLAAFAVGALPEAIALAEGLDRALLRDFVPPNSPRIGTELPVALRFRGRGTVEGQVVGPDGVTPMVGAAVNLFPDPDSRELGRGVFADVSGRFAFYGVPLGVFTLDARSSSGLGRTVVGVIDQPNGHTNVLVVLSAAQVPRTDLTGRVTEADNSTPHGQASVFVGRFRDGKFTDVVAAVTADTDGYWRAAGIPARIYDVVAVSLDGRRKGERREVIAGIGVTNQVAISLQGFGVLSGRVETPTGTPVANAIVAGGEALVRTDTNGNFRLTGVPTGERAISAGIERSLPNQPPKSTPAFAFPRVGSAQATVLPGVENFVVIRFDPAGSVIGRVVDETGTNAVTGINVALPDAGGFLWVPVNDRGEFAFEGIQLGSHTFSAPAPPVSKTDVSGVLSTLSNRGSSAGEIEAAIGEAFAIFTGAANPLINGEGLNFNPLSWGFTDVDLRADGEVKNITVQFLKQSTISGIVLNGQGVPIGARVRLTGVGPARNGAPTTVIRGERNSDPALGTFEFPKQALISDWGLQAASPFFPIVLTTNGQTSEIEVDATNIVLQFPVTRELNGRLAGTVLNPDGSPAAPGVKVRIRSRGLEISTVTNGFFDTQIALPAITDGGAPGVGYFVEAEDLIGGAVGAGIVTVLPGVTNFVTVRLLARGALEVRVVRNDGSLAPGARVDFEGGSYPRERGQLTADASGRALFLNLNEGSYAACAQFIFGPTTLNGRASATVTAGETNVVTIVLGPTGTIQGHFVRTDRVTPVTFAQVAVGTLGFATTDTNGFFQVSGVPIGSHRISSQDPVTGIGASLVTTLTLNGQVNDVTLVEQTRGEIFGSVIGSDGSTFVPGARVTLRFADGLTPERSVTTGPDGAFSFPGSPPGGFTLDAQDPVRNTVRGQVSSVLPENTARFQINVALQPLASLVVTVVRPDGVTDATNVSVRIFGPEEQSTDALNDNEARFPQLPLGSYRVVARSLEFAATRSAGQTNAVLVSAGQQVQVTVVLGGVGTVTGIVVQSNGTTPVGGATVRLRQATLLGGEERTAAADANGAYRFDNVARGDYQLSATIAALAGNGSGAIAFNGEIDSVKLILGPSGTVLGRLVRANGVQPVVGEDVTLEFPGRSLPAFLTRSDPEGRFRFGGVPLGSFLVRSTPLGFNGLVRRASALLLDGGTNDLGTIVMDEDDPRVVAVTPSDTAVGIPTTKSVELLFNEALDTNTVNAGGFFLQGPSSTVAATVLALPDSNGVHRVVRLIPDAPLRSLTTYRMVVIDGDRKDALGNVIGTGPLDQVGRPMITPFLSTFTTADNDPPRLVSVSPTNSQIQVDPRAVLRLAFNEPIRETGFGVRLEGPAGLISGTTSVGLNGLILAFAPTVDLPVNAAFTLTVSNVFDLAGNRAQGEPFVIRFNTLDTLGPGIAQLRIANGRAPVAGATVTIEADLAVTEPGASVRFTQDLAPVGFDATAPFRIPVPLPESGTTTVRAIATDRFGNDGPLAELVLAVVPNQPPSVVLSRLNPLTGPVTNGQTFSIQASATDDVDVTNVAVVVSGAIALATNFSNGNPEALVLTVPNTAPGGAAIEVRALATDSLGTTSSEAALNLTVADAQAPSITILSPASNSVLSGPSLALTVVSSDNSTNHQLALTVTGGLTATQTVSVTAGLSAPATNVFVVSLAGVPSDGANVLATLRATDTAGNVAVVSRSFRVPDTRPPQLRGVAPTNGAIGQSLWPTAAVFEFDEALDPLSLTNSLLATNNAGVPVPFAAFLADDGRQLRLALARPLRPATVYTNVLLPTLTDLSGNTWRNLGGEPVPAGGAAFRFTTAGFLGTSPTNGTRVVAGQEVNLTVNYEAGIGARAFRFQVEGFGPPVVVGAGTVAASAGIAIPTNANGAITIALAAAPDGSFNEPLNLPPVLLDVQPTGADSDGDGILNGYEIANGLNPFANDAAGDLDLDGLANRDEFLAGTRANNPDTDGDGIPDGSDPNPLNPVDGFRPTELTFDLAGIADFQDINPAYGDRVTNNVMGEFRYGGFNPFTPNITLSYGNTDPALWQLGYGALTNVLFEDADSTGVLTLRFTADPGYLARLHAFDLAAFTSAFVADPAVASITVEDAGGRRLFATNNAVVSRTSFSRFEFPQLLSGEELILRVDARNLGGLNEDIAIDNVRFSQAEAPDCTVVPPGQLAWWRFEETDGTLAADSQGTNHATLADTVVVSGPVGRARQFHTNGVFTAPGSGALNVTGNQVTLEGWLKLEANVSAVQRFTAGVGKLGFPDRQAYAIHFESGPNVGLPTNQWLFEYILTRNDGVRVHNQSTGVVLPADDTYRHVAMVYDGSVVRLFVDGVPRFQGAFSGNLRAVPDEPFRVSAGGAPFSLDELGVYARALGAAEIQAIFNAGASGKCGDDRDIDGDGMPDAYELANDFDPRRNDAGLDADGDGLTNLAEFTRGTSPRVADTDSDGMADGAEVASTCLDALNPDTDGDGLPDGTDPDPCNLGAGLAFAAPETFNLVEGTTTNLIVQVSSTNAAVLLLDYTATNLPPAFVSVKSRSAVNTATNGVATLELEFNPMHDAAGEHLLSLRAAAANGDSGVVNIRVIVADNAALGVTRWKDPVSGNWSDATKWSDGLPGVGKVAVVDVEGTYTVSLNTTVTGAGVVFNQSNAVLRTTTTVTINCPVELRAGQFLIDESRALVVNRPLANRDRIRWTSRNNTFDLQGTGRVENPGLWEVFADPANPSGGAESTVRLPVNVPAGGRLFLNRGWVVLTSGASLSVAGELDLAGDARLRLDGNNPPRDVTMLTGGVLTGTGAIQLEGSCRLVVAGNLDSGVQVVLNGQNTRLVVPGTYTVRNNLSMQGQVQAGAMVIASNATVSAVNSSVSGLLTVENGGRLRLSGGSMTFGSNVVVNSEGRFDVDVGTVIVLNEALTNQGTMRWISRNNTFDLQGTGRVENPGLWEVFADPANPSGGGESTMRLPVKVPAGGRLFLNRGWVNLTSGASLTAAGELDLAGDARLRLDGNNPPRDVTMLTGGVLTGTGAIQLEGSCRLVVPGNLDSTVQVILNGQNTRLIVPGTYTVRTPLSAQGQVQAGAMVIASNATVSAVNSSVNGLFTVENGGRLRLIGGSMTFGSNVVVNAGGRFDVDVGTLIVLNQALTNQGTMRWISRNNTFDLQGAGRVENPGLWEVFADPDNPSGGGESTMRLPVNVPAGGRLFLNRGWVNLTAGASLSVAGELDLAGDARLRLDGNNPPRDVTMLTGSVLTGTGAIQLEGSCRLVVPGNLDSTVQVILNGQNTRLIVPGTFTVRTPLSAQGQVQAGAMVIASNATVSAVNSSVNGLFTVENGGRLRLIGGSMTFGSNVVVRPGGRFDVDVGTVIVLNEALTNQGTMRWISRNNTFDLQGTGRVENPGLWEVFADPANPSGGGESTMRVPVNVPAGGRLFLNRGWVNLTSGASLTAAGELDLAGDARLRLDGNNPPRDVTMLTGGVLTGTGAIQLEGSCRLVVPGNLDSTAQVILNGQNTRLVVPGTYTVRSSVSMQGEVQAAAMVIASNATVSAVNSSISGFFTAENGGRLRLIGGSMTFGSNVVVRPGGRFDVDVGTVIVLNQALTNQGTMRWTSRNNTFDLQGSGSVENPGLWEIFADPGNPSGGAESTVRVPVAVPAGGRLFLNSGFIRLIPSGSVTILGELAMAGGGRLRLENSSPSRDLVLGSGAQVNGSGRVQLDGANRLVLQGNVTWGIEELVLRDTSSISMSEPFSLTLLPGTAFSLDHSTTIPGAVIVGGTLSLSSPSITLTISGTLTLDSTGTLINPGTIQVGAFINNGGTIVGNPPLLLSPAEPQIRLAALEWIEGTPLSLSRFNPSGHGSPVLVWTGPTQREFNIETSADLIRWTPTPGVVTEPRPGEYRATLEIPAGAIQFFRVRLK